MHHRPLVIAVYDAKWFVKVLSILRQRNIDFIVYDNNPYSIPYYSVFYTDFYYYVDNVRTRGDILIIYDPDCSPRKLEEAILATRLKNKYRELVIGIDPGTKPFAIVLGDGEILDYRKLNMNIEEIKEYIVNSRNRYPHEKIVVRIGGGYNGWKIILGIKDSMDLPVEVVDESETTPKNIRVDDPIYKWINDNYLKKLVRHGNKDAYAALKIALRKGIEVV